MNNQSKTTTAAPAAANRQAVTGEGNAPREAEALIGDAMILIGNHANRETDLGIAIDDAWNKLDDILQSIRNGEYNDAGKYTA